MLASSQTQATDTAHACFAAPAAGRPHAARELIVPQSAEAQVLARRYHASLHCKPEHLKKRQHTKRKFNLWHTAADVETDAEEMLFLTLYFEYTTGSGTRWSEMLIRYNDIVTKSWLTKPANFELRIKVPKQLMAYEQKLLRKYHESRDELFAFAAQVHTANVSHSPLPSPCNVVAGQGPVAGSSTGAAAAAAATAAVG